jgi:hypothetical protein
VAASRHAVEDSRWQGSKSPHGNDADRGVHKLTLPGSGVRSNRNRGICCSQDCDDEPRCTRAQTRWDSHAAMCVSTVRRPRWTARTRVRMHAMRWARREPQDALQLPILRLRCRRPPPGVSMSRLRGGRVGMVHDCRITRQTLNSAAESGHVPTAVDVFPAGEHGFSRPNERGKGCVSRARHGWTQKSVASAVFNGPQLLVTGCRGHGRQPRALTRKKGLRDCLRLRCSRSARGSAEGDH